MSQKDNRRSWKGALTSFFGFGCDHKQKIKKCDHRGRVRALRMESLEDRHLLAITIEVLDNVGVEGLSNDNATAIVRTDTPTASSRTIYFSLGGTASSPTYSNMGTNPDYYLFNSSGTQLSETWVEINGNYDYVYAIELPANASSAIIELRAVNDSLRESTETATLTLCNNSNYTVDPDAEAVVLSILDNDDWEISVSATVTAGVVPFLAPSELTATVTDLTSIGLSWTASDLQSQYNIERSTDSQNWAVLQSNYSGTTYNDTSLPMGYTYYYRVSSWQPIPGASAPSATASAALPLVLPNVPELTTVLLVDEQTVALAWSAASGADSFTLQRSVDSANWTTIHANISTLAWQDNDNWIVDVPTFASVGRETTSNETPVPVVFRFTRSGSSDLTYPLTVCYLFDGEAERDNDSVMSIDIPQTIDLPEGSTLDLVASIGANPLGTNWTFIWDLDNDSIFGETGTDANWGNESGHSVLLDASGLTSPATRTISVRAVDDQDNTVTTTVTVSITNVAPSVICSGTTTIPVDELASWSGSFTDPGNDTWTMTVDYGDETTATITPNQDKTFLFNHTYATAGWYTVTLSISDGEDTTVITRTITVGTPSALAVTLVDLHSTPIPAGSAITLYSSYSSGPNPINPKPGEAVALQLRVHNESLDVIELDYDNAILPSGVSWVTQPFGELVPGDSASATLLWHAYSNLNGNIVLPVTEVDCPDYSFTLTGTIAGIIDTPEIDNIELRHDTGNDSDNATWDPVLKITASGEFGGGYAIIEFDHDNDGIPDGETTIYGTDWSALYDPSKTATNWIPPELGTAPVAIQYRLVHYHRDDTVWSTGQWSTFSCTLIPVPAGNDTISDLAITRGYGGTWSDEGAAILTGSLSTNSTSKVEILLDGNLYKTNAFDGSFEYYLPALTPGQSYTASVRALTTDEADSVYHPGPWSSVTFSTNPPELPALTLQNDDGSSSNDNISSDITLTGTLNPGVGYSYAEIEISLGSTLLGTTWTNADGTFSFTPKTILVVNDVASGTYTACAILRNADREIIARGTSASCCVTYVPSGPPPLVVSLAQPDPDVSNCTNVPIVSFSCEASESSKVQIEYQWKVVDNNWSSSVILSPRASGRIENESGTFIEYETDSRLIGTGTIPSGISTVQLRYRPVIYDPLLDSERAGDWAEWSFLYNKEDVNVYTVESLSLQYYSSASPLTTTRPVLTGTIDSTSSIANKTVRFFSDNTLLGSTVTDEYGAFSWEAESIPEGAVTIEAKVRFWNTATQAWSDGTSSEISFIRQFPSILTPSISRMMLWDDTGTRGDGITANPIIAGSLRNDGNGMYRVVIEYDTNGDGIGEGITATNEDGTFYFTPIAEPGFNTVRARAIRWNVFNSSEVTGNWYTLSYTYVAPDTSAAASLITFEPAEYVLNSAGIPVTRSTLMTGRVSSESGYENVVVEFDLDGDAIPDHETTPDERGIFRWNPVITTASEHTNVLAAIRLGMRDPLTDIVTDVP